MYIYEYNYTYIPVFSWGRTCMTVQLYQYLHKSIFILWLV